eukprot:7177030-Pyramimonas_sp.AAC.2
MPVMAASTSMSAACCAHHIPGVIVRAPACHDMQICGGTSPAERVRGEAELAQSENARQARQGGADLAARHKKQAGTLIL